LKFEHFATFADIKQRVGGHRIHSN